MISGVRLQWPQIVKLRIFCQDSFDHIIERIHEPCEEVEQGLLEIFIDIEFIPGLPQLHEYPLSHVAKFFEIV